MDDSCLIDVLLLTVTQGLAYFIQEHLTFYARMTGAKSTNAMIAMIYDKTFRISSATNKRFTQGELVNFVQVDALKLQFESLFRDALRFQHYFASLQDGRGAEVLACHVFKGQVSEDFVTFEVLQDGRAEIRWQ